jgi:hypothetical protein
MFGFHDQDPRATFDFLRRAHRAATPSFLAVYHRISHARRPLLAVALESDQEKAGAQGPIKACRGNQKEVTTETFHFREHESARQKHGDSATDDGGKGRERR